jgi:uncharacterized membrane protein YqhA
MFEHYLKSNILLIIDIIIECSEIHFCYLFLLIEDLKKNVLQKVAAITLIFHILGFQLELNQNQARQETI